MSKKEKIKKPRIIHIYDGKPLLDYTKDELVDIVENLLRFINKAKQEHRKLGLVN